MVSGIGYLIFFRLSLERNCIAPDATRGAEGQNFCGFGTVVIGLDSRAENRSQQFDWLGGLLAVLAFGGIVLGLI
jgi:hypothetical protein